MANGVNKQTLQIGGGNDNNKGYFSNPTALNTAYPTGSDGWYAVVGSTDTIWIWDSGTTAWVNSGASSTGDVSGPASSTDNAIARYDGTTGKIIQNSGATISDAGNITATNLSGTNTGDQTSIVGIAGTKAQFDTAVTDGNFLYVGDVTQYTDEMAQDAVGAMVDSTLVYNDAAPSLGRAAITGDVTISAGSNSATIPNDTVTYAKMQNVSATSRILGRITSGAGDTEELTGTQATTLLDTFTSGLKGLTPASGGGTTNFLRADGTWASPGGGGSINSGSFTCDFGTNTAQVYYKTVTVTDANVTLSSKPVISLYNAGSRDADEIEMVDLKCSVSSVGTGTFDVYVSDGAMQAEGSYNFNYILI